MSVEFSAMTDAELDELEADGRRMVDRVWAERHRRVVLMDPGVHFWADLRVSLEQAADPATTALFEQQGRDRSFALLVEGAPPPRPEILSRVATAMLVEDGFREEVVAQAVAQLGIDWGLDRRVAIQATARGIRAARGWRSHAAA